MYSPIDISNPKKNNLNDILPEMKYILIFDQKIDGPGLDELYKNTKNKVLLKRLKKMLTNVKKVMIVTTMYRINFSHSTIVRIKLI